jgi:hypothetical protein
MQPSVHSTKLTKQVGPLRSAARSVVPVSMNQTTRKCGSAPERFATDDLRDGLSGSLVTI